jgi:hypothetical protein
MGTGVAQGVAGPSPSFLSSPTNLGPTRSFVETVIVQSERKRAMIDQWCREIGHARIAESRLLNFRFSQTQHAPATFAAATATASDRTKKYPDDNRGILVKKESRGDVLDYDDESA